MQFSVMVVVLDYQSTYGKFEDTTGIIRSRQSRMTDNTMAKEKKVIKLKSSLQIVFTVTMTWSTLMEYLCHRTTYMFRSHNLVLFYFMTYYMMYNTSNTNGT